MAGNAGKFSNLHGGISDSNEQSVRTSGICVYGKRQVLMQSLGELIDQVVHPFLQHWLNGLSGVIF